LKIKTSITLSEDLLQQVDQLAEQYGTRSALIEQAVQEFVALAARRNRDARDVEILNRRAKSLNAEASDVLAYQVEL
jgi:metal-responsive CopG/Arc/MetJ family transcriptional regulator